MAMSGMADGMKRLLGDGDMNGAKRPKVLCRHFARGYCQLGDTCGFGHWTEPSMLQMGGSDFGKGKGMVVTGKGTGSMTAMSSKGMGSTASGGSGYAKTKICWHWSTSGNCARGAACCFAHGEHELGSPQPDPGAAPSWGGKGDFAAPSWSAKGGGKAMATAALQGGGSWGGIGSWAGGGAYGATGYSQEAKQVYNYKTAQCRNFAETGTCPRGDNCTFAHGDTELKQQGDVMEMLNDSNGSSASSVGMAFNKGMAKGKAVAMGAMDSWGKGMAQTRSKEDIQMYNYKTALCKDFAASGTCPRGESCSFAHGDHEVTTPGEVMQAMSQIG
eukprot:CAMPEP_0197663112 /NCGR_PEP_ID=MMETSP1338-20131121/56140_1 /TAXON_ID=43686 ORGANISM="Pelagodinium beii, Strain RCC1491" /NCGR_SAMPLE_ID=MMETSP1338 /ASSEMBLY_ACC=CAM_ASM_000754 /LENGTH=329 /DNA_ID=CAMNT_0043241319 /DNA_START=60 /DNA_END=1049 /DNA_ORIENTATION=-